MSALPWIFCLIADARIPNGKRRALPRLWPSIAASIAFHIVIVAAVLLFSALRAVLETSEQDSIAVEIVAPQRFESVREGTATAKRVFPTAPATSTGRAHSKDSAAAPLTPKVEKKQQKSTLIAATKLYAETLLAAPKSRKTRAALQKLGTEENDPTLQHRGNGANCSIETSLSA
jgi:hypothetical protein